MLKDLNYILTPKDKIYFIFLLILSVLVSVIETFSISMIMPFFSIIANMKLLETNKVISTVYKLAKCGSPLRFIFFAGISLMLLMVIRGFVNSGYFYLLIKFSRTRFRTLANRLFKRYLDLTYLDFSKESSANLTQNMLIEANGLTAFIYAILLMLSEIFVIIMIYSILIIMNWKIALTITIFLLAMGLGLTFATSTITKNAGKKREHSQNQLLRTINEAFGNYRFLKFIENKNYIINRFYHSSTGFIHAEGIFSMLSALPKIVMETVGIIAILGILLFVIYFYHDPKYVVPILTMYGLAFFRLMPSINRIMTSWTQILYNDASYKRVAKELSRPIEKLGQEELVFNKSITMHKVGFDYLADKTVISGLSMDIPKGTKVAFWGANGSGKSTAMDLLSGLLTPNKGEICIDGHIIDNSNVLSWRRKIGYIPQQFYLFEGTVKENILCGRIDSSEKYEKACKLAGVLDFISIEKSEKLWVGENGNQLSGGQKQRVAVARALFDNPEVILLDEATSALDKESGKEILANLFKVLTEKTIIMVTHNEESLTLCDQVIKF